MEISDRMPVSEMIRRLSAIEAENPGAGVMLDAEGVPYGGVDVHLNVLGPDGEYLASLLETCSY